jgi:hypothetical protein
VYPGLTDDMLAFVARAFEGFFGRRLRAQREESP